MHPARLTQQCFGPNTIGQSTAKKPWTTHTVMPKLFSLLSVAIRVARTASEAAQRIALRAT
jgi:hypothetical protein